MKESPHWCLNIMFPQQSDGFGELCRLSRIRIPLLIPWGCPKLSAVQQQTHLNSSAAVKWTHIQVNIRNHRALRL